MKRDTVNCLQVSIFLLYSIRYAIPQSQRQPLFSFTNLFQPPQYQQQQSRNYARSIPPPQPFASLTQEPQTASEDELRNCRAQLSNTFFNQAFRAIVTGVRPYLSQGIPEFGVPPLDPLKFKNPVFLEHDGGIVKLNLTLTNVQVFGLQNFNNTNWFLDINKRVLDLNLEMPVLHLTADFIIFPMGSSGNLSVTMRTVLVTSTIKLLLIDTWAHPEKNPILTDTAVLNVNSNSVVIESTDMFKDPGSEDINRALGVFLKENGAMIFDEFYRHVQPLVESSIVGISDQILSSTSFSARAGLPPALNLSPIANIYDRVRNAIQLPPIVTESLPYRSAMDFLQLAFQGCRSYTSFSDRVTRPFLNLLGNVLHRSSTNSY